MVLTCATLLPASTVLVVIGGGMIGLLMVQLAKLAGAHEIILSEPVAVKREMGLEVWVLLLTVDPINDNIPALLADKGIHRINTAYRVCWSTCNN